MRTVVAMDALPRGLRHAVDSGIGKTVCPKCDGGRSNETSLYVHYGDDSVVSFKCYRASCGWYATTVGGEGVKFEARKVKQGRPYRDPVLPLDAYVLDNLAVDYGLDPVTVRAHGWSLTENRQELVMTIRDPYGRERGHQTRTLYAKQKRCYTFKATSQPFLDWWLDQENTSPVVVVEDTLSACRLSGLGYNAVALLGTGISREDAREIRQAAGERAVYLALDRDAFDKALKLRDRHAHILRIDKVICLNEDIKNMDYDSDIREILDGRDNSASSNLRLEKSL